MRLLLMTFALLFLCACGDGRWAPGYLVSNEGETLSNTAENKRKLTLQTITSQLNLQLGGHWLTDAVIDELPKYERGSDDDGKSVWTWPKATVTITLIGDGKGDVTLTDEQVTAAVRDYLYHQVNKPNSNLSVTTARVVDATRFTAQAQPPTSIRDTTATKPTNPSSGTKRYVVQPGDTWADLSQAFYGSSQHWRLIAEANPGVELTPGRDIVIPIKP